MIAEKTACLIAAAGRFGGTFSGAAPDQVERLGRIGGIIGTVFQISDDIIDIESDPDESGKRPAPTCARRAHPPGALRAARETGPDADRLRELLKGPVTDDADVAEALALLQPPAGSPPPRRPCGNMRLRRGTSSRASPDVPGRRALASLVDYTVNRHG